MEALEVRVLGPLALSYGGTPIALGGAKLRAVVALLATASDHTASVEALVEAVWGSAAPDRAEHSLQQHLSALRKSIGAAGHPDPSAALARRGPAYVLTVDRSDAVEFEADLAQATAAARAGRHDAAAEASARALAHWRGIACTDARDAPQVHAAATRLDALRLAALGVRFDALLASDRASEMLPEVQAAVGAHPLHEQFRGQLMLALYRSGRQAEALAAFRDARDALVDQLGIEPTPELRALERAILEQSPVLDAAPRAVAVTATFAADAMYALARLELSDGQMIVLDGDASIVGRDPSASVRFVDARVSRSHAVIERRGIAGAVRDLGSTNGTFVNGARVDDSLLADGDRISFGGVEVTYRSAT